MTNSPRVAALIAKTRLQRGRLIFALDATASREGTWDMASQLQGAMFQQAAAIGSLDVQLIYFRGSDEVKHSSWFCDAGELVRRMSMIRCAAGATKIARVLRHIRTEHEREKISAAIFIGDAVEEAPDALYDAADPSVPLFVFQEGDGDVVYLNDRGEFTSGYPPTKVEQVFRELARLTNGAYAKFDAGSADRLRELLQAVAAFVTGGRAALANQHTDSARALLGQIK